QPDDVFRYVHEESDTDVVVRIRDLRAAVPWGTFASTRKILDGRGILSATDFDQRVRELEQTLGKPGATANGAPKAARGPGRSRSKPRGVVKDNPEERLWFTETCPDAVRALLPLLKQYDLAHALV